MGLPMGNVRGWWGLVSCSPWKHYCSFKFRFCCSILYILSHLFFTWIFCYRVSCPMLIKMSYWKSFLFKIAFLFFWTWIIYIVIINFTHEPLSFNHILNQFIYLFIHNVVNTYEIATQAKSEKSTKSSIYLIHPHVSFSLHRLFWIVILF